MKIGYACLLVGVAGTGFKTCIKKNATQEKLQNVIDHNLRVLDRMIDYNIDHDIGLFRMSSDLIPFGSSPVNTLKWEEIFSSQWEAMGKKIKENNMRISMHPGQYTVLNSPRKEVVKRAVADLEYHVRVLECLDSSQKNKIILHIGGAYGDKRAAMDRFVENYRRLSDRIKKHLIIENDDKIYRVKEVLDISERTGAPVVLDVFHDKINPDPDHTPVDYWLRQCQTTWKKEDGTPKIHYSEQNPLKQPGSHSETIGGDSFLSWMENLRGMDVDIMLEVKDKNLSAVKCLNLVDPRGKMKTLEQEWARYKYLVLEHSQRAYDQVRELLKKKSGYPAQSFYQIIDQSLKSEPDKSSAVNALDHVWGHLKKSAEEREHQRYRLLLERYRQGTCSLNTVKKHLWKLVVKYQEPYLIQSLYFKEVMD